MKDIIKNNNVIDNKNPIDDFDPNKLTQSYLDTYKSSHTFDDCISYKNQYDKDKAIADTCLSNLYESLVTETSTPTPTPITTETPTPSSDIVPDDIGPSVIVG